jgi:hypothetical protein
VRVGLNELAHHCATLAGMGRRGTVTWAVEEIYNQAGLGWASSTNGLCNFTKVFFCII